VSRRRETIDTKSYALRRWHWRGGSCHNLEGRAARCLVAARHQDAHTTRDAWWATRWVPALHEPHTSQQRQLRLQIVAMAMAMAMAVPSWRTASAPPMSAKRIDDGGAGVTNDPPSKPSGSLPPCPTVSRGGRSFNEQRIVRCAVSVSTAAAVAGTDRYRWMGHRQRLPTTSWVASDVGWRQRWRRHVVVWASVSIWETACSVRQRWCWHWAC